MFCQTDKTGTNVLQEKYTLKMNALFTNMKYFIKLTIVLLFLASIYACNTTTEEEKDTKEIDSVAIHNPAQEELNSNQSELLQTVLGIPAADENPASIIRGVSFGDAISKVKATETFEMFEETADHLGYTKETAKLETIDVQYFLTPDKKVSKITVDVYLNSADATKQLWNAGKNYFTEKYAAPKEDKEILTWNKNSVRVNMEDVSEGKDYGLKFEFFPSGKTILAVK